MENTVLDITYTICSKKLIFRQAQRINIFISLEILLAGMIFQLEDCIHVIDKPILIGKPRCFSILERLYRKYSIIGSPMRYKLGESMKPEIYQRSHPITDCSSMIFRYDLGSINISLQCVDN